MSSTFSRMFKMFHTRSTIVQLFFGKLSELQPSSSSLIIPTLLAHVPHKVQPTSQSSIILLLLVEFLHVQPSSHFLGEVNTNYFLDFIHCFTSLAKGSWNNLISLNSSIWPLNSRFSSIVQFLFILKRYF